MTAVTLPNIEAGSSDWVQLSSADRQTIQLVKGSAGVVFSDTKPDAAYKVGMKGHVIRPEGFVTTDSGGTSWGRSYSLTAAAIFAVTESDSPIIKVNVVV